MNNIPTGFDWLMIIASLISVKAILLIRLIPYIALLMQKISKKKTKLEKDEETEALCNI